LVDAGLGKGLTKSVGSVYGKKDTREPNTSYNCHLDFNHLTELDMSVKEDAKGSLDTKSVGSSDGGNDLFCERSAVGLVVELLSTVFGQKKPKEGADDCYARKNRGYSKGKLP
jgi:hypothetical protein